MKRAEAALGRDDFWIRVQSDGSGAAVEMEDNEWVSFETLEQFEAWIKSPFLPANSTVTIESLAQGRGIEPAGGKEL